MSTTVICPGCGKEIDPEQPHVSCRGYGQKPIRPFGMPTEVWADGHIDPLEKRRWSDRKRAQRYRERLRERRSRETEG